MLAELEAAVTPSGATTPHIGAIKPRTSDQAQRRGLFVAIGSALVLLTLASSTWYWYDSKAPPAIAVATDTTPSLAVLPFDNLGKADDAYFAEGMTEEISSRLGTLPGMRVIGRQSVKGYANSEKPIAQIGKELGVAYLLTGTVRWDRSRAGHNLVKVSPALLRASDGVQIWAEPYQNEVTGVFEIQGKVAERVAQALRLHLTEGQQQKLTSRPTNNLEAYDYYLRGNALEAGTFDPARYSRAVVLYERAIALDSGFAKAYTSLAGAHLLVYWFLGDPSPRRLELAKNAVDAALALDPKLPDAQLALADYHYHGKLDYPRALAAIEDVLRLAPKNPDALYLKALIERRQSRWNEAIADMNRALEVDPRNISYLDVLCEIQIWTKRYDDAQTTCGRRVALQPEERLGYFLLSAIPVLRSGDTRTALAVLETARNQVGDDDVGAGLMSDGRIWPALLNPDLARSMATSAVPAGNVQRLNYFGQMLRLGVYGRNEAAVLQYADSIIRNAPLSVHGAFFDSEIHARLALAYAAKGDKAKTLEEGREAMRIVPIERDAVRAAGNLRRIADAAVLVGANDEALTMLRRLLDIPGYTTRIRDSSSS
jgi:TolB-like protein